jgi:hypothetical protein
MFAGLLAMASSAQALPTFSASCVNCHAAQRNRMTVVTTTTVDLGAARLDGQRPGALKTFSVRRGGSVIIPIDVLNGSSVYSVEVSGFNRGGLVNSATNRMRYVPDAAFAQLGSPPYYVSSRSGVGWSGSRTRVNFKLTIKSTCPVDYYQVLVTVAGSGGGKWSQSQRIYVRVKP